MIDKCSFFSQSSWSGIGRTKVGRPRSSSQQFVTQRSFHIKHYLGSTRVDSSYLHLYSPFDKARIYQTNIVVFEGLFGLPIFVISFDDKSQQLWYRHKKNRKKNVFWLPRKATRWNVVHLYLRWHPSLTVGMLDVPNTLGRSEIFFITNYRPLICIDRALKTHYSKSTYWVVEWSRLQIWNHYINFLII